MVSFLLLSYLACVGVSSAAYTTPLGALKGLGGFKTYMQICTILKLNDIIGSKSGLQTILAPTDEAFAAYFETLKVTKQAWFANYDNLRSIGLYTILPQVFYVSNQLSVRFYSRGLL